MRFYERFIYGIIFLLSKYSGFEAPLIWYENQLIKKYLGDKEVPASEIPTIQAEDLTDDIFRRLSDNYRRPVLIKGFMKNSQAAARWDLDYLKDEIGDFKVNTVKFDDGVFKIDNMEFTRFADKINENYYLNNNHTILSAFPEIFEDIKPEFQELMDTLHSSNLNIIHIANLFIGSSPERLESIPERLESSPETTDLEQDDYLLTGSNMHCGGSGNFFCMLRGRKHWTLIDPALSPLLKGRVAPNGIHAQTLFDMLDSPLGEVPEAFKRLPRYEVTMDEGDILWNAPWWWHRIVNEPGLSIGMAIRNNKVTRLNLQNNPIYTMSGWIYLLYNSWIIDLYERIRPDGHFRASASEGKGDSVLYQIEQLIHKYPQSISLETILNP